VGNVGGVADHRGFLLTHLPSTAAKVPGRRTDPGGR
jgi:hypothetical protein